MSMITRLISCITAAVAASRYRVSHWPRAGPPPQVLPEGIRGGSEIVPEPPVQIRKYVFKETGEELPYSVFVSSKVKKGQKAPLVLALRGFTGTTLTIVRGTAVDLAEQGGYILVGAIGYNNRAGFGVPPRARPPAAAAECPLRPPPLPAGAAAPAAAPRPGSRRSSAAPRRPIR